MIVSDRYKFVYIDIPKTASMTLDHLFKSSYSGKSIKRINGGDTLGVQRIKHTRIVPETAKNYIKIASVRNPYDKIISQYFFNRRKKYLRGDTQTFEDFVRFVERISNEGAADSLDDQIYGYFPCWKYLEPIGFDYIIRTENLEEDLKKLPFIKEPIKVATRNRTNHPTWAELKTKELNDLIIKWAGKDFDLFGYEKDVA
jgi:hypothetical protein